MSTEPNQEPLPPPQQPSLVNFDDLPPTPPSNSQNQQQQQTTTPAATAPSTQHQSVPRTAPQHRRDDKQKEAEEFLGGLKFLNRLPDVPHEPKLLKIPHDPLRFVKYHTTSLETGFKYPILSFQDVVQINSVDPYEYSRHEEGATLAPEDEALINPRVAQPATKKQEMPKSAVPWLKPVESGQIPGLSRRSSRYDKVAMKPEEIKSDKDSEIRVIEETFKAMQNFKPVHPTDPSLTCEIYPVVPSVKLDPVSYVLATFDSEQTDSKNSSFIREVEGTENTAPSKNKFVSFIIPAENPETGYYLWEKEYECTQKDTQPNTIAFILGPAPPAHKFLTVPASNCGAPLSAQLLSVPKRVTLSKIAGKQSIDMIRRHTRPSYVSVTPVEIEVQNDQEQTAT